MLRPLFLNNLCRTRMDAATRPGRRRASAAHLPGMGRPSIFRLWTFHIWTSCCTLVPAKTLVLRADGEQKALARQRLDPADARFVVGAPSNYAYILLCCVPFGGRSIRPDETEGWPRGWDTIRCGIKPHNQMRTRVQNQVRDDACGGQLPQCCGGQLPQPCGGQLPQCCGGQLPQPCGG